MKEIAGTRVEKRVLFVTLEDFGLDEGWFVAKVEKARDPETNKDGLWVMVEHALSRS